MTKDRPTKPEAHLALDKIKTVVAQHLAVKEDVELPTNISLVQMGVQSLGMMYCHQDLCKEFPDSRSDLA